uniref:Erythropoietin receptor n=1 Tax=Sphenodon punctatus TaxID=8508 RepID=A0A8D0L9X5_SPHPU
MGKLWRYIATLVALLLGPTGLCQRPGSDFNSKAALLLREDPKDPKCLTQWLEDLTCFWEIPEPPQSIPVPYSFHYQIEGEPEQMCHLNVTQTPWNTTRYSCVFPVRDTPSFTHIGIKIFAAPHPNITLYSRTVTVNELVILDPPSNLSAHPTETPGQLHVRWAAPRISHLDTSILYEVAFAAAGAEAQRVEINNKGRTECLITNLRGQTRYSLAVRARPDGVSYNGYWSAWSQRVTVVTPSDLDPLILTLSFILVLIILLLAFITLMTHRRFLKKKIWPAIPSPEREFDGLFTIYKGNFQLWLGQRYTYLWWGQTPLYREEQPSLLEILAETPKPEGAPALPPKSHGPAEDHPASDDYLVLDEDLIPCSPGGDSSPLLPDGGGAPGTPAAAGETSSSSCGTPEPSRASSFEYTVFDPSSESLSPRSRPADAPQLKYTYVMVSDSGISTDYSPVSSSFGQSSHYTNLSPGTMATPVFPPSYVLCS